jgi:hypothetical protein
VEAAGLSLLLPLYLLLCDVALQPSQTVQNSQVLSVLRCIQVALWSTCMENQDIDSVDPKSKPDTPATETQSNPDLIPEIPPSVEHKTERTHSNPDPTPLWKIVLEVGAVAVGIVVACIYYGQLDVMRGQLGEIIKQYLRRPTRKKSTSCCQTAKLAMPLSRALTRRNRLEWPTTYRDDPLPVCWPLPQRAWEPSTAHRVFIRFFRLFRS